MGNGKWGYIDSEFDIMNVVILGISEMRWPGAEKNVQINTELFTQGGIDATEEWL